MGRYNLFFLLTLISVHLFFFLHCLCDHKIVNGFLYPTGPQGYPDGQKLLTMAAFLVVSFEGGSFFVALVTGGPMRWAGTVRAERRGVGLTGERDREGSKSTDRPWGCMWLVGARRMGWGCQQGV